MLRSTKKVRNWCAVMLVLATTGVASAGRTTVFPMSGSGLPANVANAPDKLTRALAAEIGAEVASVPIEDAAGLLECDLETTKCLEAVAKSVNADRIVFGNVTWIAASAKVYLTRFDLGPARVQRTFVLNGDTADELARQLVTETRPLFDRAQPAASAPPAPDPTTPIEPALPPPAEPTRGPTMATWMMIGGGVVLAGAGAGLLISARGIRDDVDQAPRDTVEDFENLVALEDKGRFRTRMGFALVAAGGAVTAFGIVRAIMQRGEPARDRNALRIDPVPLAGGVGLVLTVGAP